MESPNLACFCMYFEIDQDLVTMSFAFLIIRRLISIHVWDAKCWEGEGGHFKKIMYKWVEYGIVKFLNSARLLYIWLWIMCKLLCITTRKFSFLYDVTRLTDVWLSVNISGHNSSVVRALVLVLFARGPGLEFRLRLDFSPPVTFVFWNLK